jgi:hypothetical protein
MYNLAYQRLIISFGISLLQEGSINSFDMTNYLGYTYTYITPFTHGYTPRHITGR